MPKKTAIVEHAGTGFRMPEDTARKIDELSKGLPREFSYRRVAKSVDDLRIDAGERTDVSVIASNNVDRDGEVILPSGGDWSDYNRVVCWAHSYDSLPVGSNWWIKAQGEELIAKTHYAPKPPDWGDGPWMPSAILHLMQQPVPTCTGKSVGVLPLHARKATADEIARDPEMRGATIIDKWKGMEYSVCCIGVLPEAEMQAVSKCERDGLVSRQFADMIRKSLTYMPKKLNTASDMAKYSHIDFKAPKEVQKAHKEGVERHVAGESKGHATVEMLAMAKHMADGGEASPEYVRKAAAYHEQNAHHLAAKPGTPAYCLAMLHGGHAGREHYKAMCKAMEDADAAPMTAVDENSMPLDSAVTKSAGASENVAADGGNAVPVQQPADVLRQCPDCKTDAEVEVKGIDPVKGKLYECGMCGKSFAEPETVAANGDVNKPPQRNAGDNDGDELPGNKTKSIKDKETVGGGKAAAEAVSATVDVPVAKAVLNKDQINKAVQRELESRQSELLAKAVKRAEDLAILAMGGV